MNIRNMIGEDRLAKGLWWGKGVNLITGCTKVSPACDNCWSLSMQERFGKEPPGVVFHEYRLKAFKRKEPTVFSIWNDLFHEDVDTDALMATFTEMIHNPQHIYMILTKRPFFEHDQHVYDDMKEVKNLWLGTTVESPEYLYRIDDLLNLRPYASKLFVSVEPMLGEIDLTKHLPGKWKCTCDGHLLSENEFPRFRTDGVDWVICGAESGTNRRPTDIEWVRELRDQCQSVGVPFFLKQLAEGSKMVKAPELDGRQWLELPEIGG